MRIGLRGAFGQSTINLTDDATVGDLSSKITQVSSYSSFDLKAGFPPKAIDLTHFDPSLKLADTGLKLNGERVQVNERKVKQNLSTPLAGTTSTKAPSSPSSTTAPAKSPAKSTSQASKPMKPLPLKKKPNKIQEDPPALPLSDGNFLVHRVMPDDNSCLFRALGKCLLGSDVDGMIELRSTVAQGIQADTERFSAVVLEKEPDDYCRWIQNPNSWGGAVEITIIAEAFGIEVCAVNLEDCSVQRFNEGQAMRVFLVYSGIHWDALASNAVGKWGPPDIDITQFDANDVEIETKAVEIGRLLSAAGYFTNTTSFAIKCNICGWVGKGEKGAVEHAGSTGHQDFGEA
jgi:ubiquitin thioesterase OTU1